MAMGQGRGPAVRRERRPLRPARRLEAGSGVFGYDAAAARSGRDFSRGARLVFCGGFTKRADVRVLGDDGHLGPKREARRVDGNKALDAEPGAVCSRGQRDGRCRTRRSVAARARAARRWQRRVAARRGRRARGDQVAGPQLRACDEGAARSEGGPPRRARALRCARALRRGCARAAPARLRQVPRRGGRTRRFGVFRRRRSCRATCVERFRRFKGDARDAADVARGVTRRGALGFRGARGASRRRWRSGGACCGCRARYGRFEGGALSAARHCRRVARTRRQRARGAGARGGVL
mmetsp:Transcript_32172/g.111192  ORF Transcript_32172/g.111192 Transcript_32172/m.111192 type:complete len:295 (-) Transcript_32172:828-1712(-)